MRSSFKNSINTVDITPDSFDKVSLNSDKLTVNEKRKFEDYYIEDDTILGEV